MRFLFLILCILSFQTWNTKDVFGQTHKVEKGAIKLAIKVTLDDRILPIDSLCDGFDPLTKVPLNLVIPEGSSLGVIPDSMGPVDIALVVNNEAPKYINRPNNRSNGFSMSSSPGSENSYAFINETNQDTLKISWKVGYAPLQLADLYPAEYFKNYVALQIQYIFEDYPDSSQYDWGAVEYIENINERGIPVSPSFPYSDNGLYFVVDQLTEDAKVQLKGFHKEIQSLDTKNPFDLFLYEDLNPGEYELVVWPYEGASEAISLHYAFVIQNPWWKEAPALVGFGMGLVLVVGGIGFIFFRNQQKRKTKELEWSQRLTEAELTAIRAQLNPHFLFNALNSIQNLVSQEKNDLANSYILKLSKYLRRVLSISNKQFHDLEQEIELTELYLDLEKLRYEFSATVHVDSAVPVSTLIPVMLLQPYVENAVKHGVASLGKEGEIQVVFSRKSDFLQIEILDNGPGLKEANELSTGLELGKKQIQNLNHIYLGEATVEISNRMDQSGVRVLIKLPLES
ncbi:histidine kinase [Algoriphagus sp. SE2]|uniref:sensor histidine kinase n=1 Tax=Algoriphagus sp. SE2 TaxID=3141536 RepID=UPI0031CD3A23